MTGLVTLMARCLREAWREHTWSAVALIHGGPAHSSECPHGRNPGIAASVPPLHTAVPLKCGHRSPHGKQRWWGRADRGWEAEVCDLGILLIWGSDSRTMWSENGSMRQHNPAGCLLGLSSQTSFHGRVPLPLDPPFLGFPLSCHHQESHPLHSARVRTHQPLDPHGHC